MYHYPGACTEVEMGHRDHDRKFVRFEVNNYYCSRETNVKASIIDVILEVICKFEQCET